MRQLFNKLRCFFRGHELVRRTFTFSLDDEDGFPVTRTRVIWCCERCGGRYEE